MSNRFTFPANMECANACGRKCMVIYEIENGEDGVTPDGEVELEKNGWSFGPYGEGWLCPDCTERKR